MIIQTKRNINDTVEIFGSNEEWLIVNVKLDIYTNGNGEIEFKEIYTIEFDDKYLHNVSDKDIKATY